MEPLPKVGAPSPRQSRFLHVFAEHWLVGIMLGVLFAIILLVLSPLVPLRQLERMGGDAAAELALLRAEAYIKPEDVPRIVFVSIDEASLAAWQAPTARDARPQIINLIRAVRAAMPRVVAVDMGFSESQASATALRDALAAEGPPVVLAAPLATTLGQGDKRYDRLAAGPPYPDPLPSKVTFAGTQVVMETDGVVRSLRPYRCVEQKERWQRLPSFAHAVVAQVRPDFALRTDADCLEHAPDISIVFLIGPEQGKATSPVRGWFRTVSALDLPRLPAPVLAGSIVVIGQDNQASTEDRLWTPVGEMPGALLHANAIAGLLHVGTPAKSGHGTKILLKFLLIIIAATTGAFYWGLRALVFARSGKTSEESFVMLLADLGMFLAVTAFTLAAVAMTAVKIGAEALMAGGIGLGSLVPAFAVALEALVEFSRVLMVWLHRAAAAVVARVTRLLPRGGAVATAALLLGLLLPSTAHAQQPAALLRLGTGNFAAINVQRPGVRDTLQGIATLELFAGDTVRVHDRQTTARILYLSDVPRLEEARINKPHIVEAAAASRESWQLWRSLIDLLQRLGRDPAPRREPEAKSMTDLAPGTSPPRPSVASTATAAAAAPAVAMLAPSRDTRVAAAASTVSRSQAPAVEAANGAWSILLGSFPTEREALRSAARAASEANETSARAIAVRVTPEDRGAPRYLAKVVNLSREAAVDACNRARTGGGCAAPSPDMSQSGSAARRLAFAAGLAEGEYLLPPEARSFPLAWSGGSGRYAVNIRNDDGSEVIGSQVVQGARSITVAPGFTDGSRTRRVTIVDMGNNETLQLTVRAADAADLPLVVRSETGQILQLPAAAWLYDQHPAWRLEGLRRLHLLAEQRNPEAQILLQHLQAQ
jgi:hypothetical protein